MSLSLEDVRHVAMLARLGLTEEEMVTMQEQLSSILGHIDVLNELDTNTISPTAQACASPGLFTEVSTDGDISGAMQKLFNAAVMTAHLTN